MSSEQVPPTAGPADDNFDPADHTWDGDLWWTADRSFWWDGGRWVDTGREAAPRTRVAAGRQFPIGPLAWILLTPLATLPATAVVTGALTPAFGGTYATLDALKAGAAANPYCTVQISFGPMAILGLVDAHAVCPDGYVLAALSPGLLNLLPLFWLFSRLPSTRRAAILASVLGGLRLLIPAIGVLAVAAPSDYGSVGHGFTVITPGTPWQFPNSWNAIPLVSAALWVATLVTYLVNGSMERRMRRVLDYDSEHGAPG